MLLTVEEVGVVGALPQLHQDVLQAHLLHLAGAVDDVDILQSCIRGPQATTVTLR